MAVMKTTSKYIGDGNSQEPAKNLHAQNNSHYGISLSPTWTNRLVILENFSEAWWERRTNVATSIATMPKQDKAST
jgi:hypothetical protein